MMTDRRPSNAEEHIRDLARRYRVAYADTVELDEIERLLIGLQRAGHLSRPEMILLQARYLREAKP
jgi:hypothetical protein